MIPEVSPQSIQTGLRTVLNFARNNKDKIFTAAANSFSSNTGYTSEVEPKNTSYNKTAIAVGVVGATCTAIGTTVGYLFGRRSTQNENRERTDSLNQSTLHAQELSESLSNQIDSCKETQERALEEFKIINAKLRAELKEYGHTLEELETEFQILEDEIKRLTAENQTLRILLKNLKGQ